MRLLTALLIFSTSYIYSQNLVENFSFEDSCRCDSTTEIVKSVANWEANSGKPQFINTSCPLSKQSKAYILANKIPPAYTGKTFVGMGLDRKGEYMQGKLKTKLEKGSKYIVSMQVRLAIPYCSTPIPDIGIALTPQAFKKSKDYATHNYEALILQKTDKTPISNQYKWQEIQTTYVADGTEEFITFGIFSNNCKGVFENRTKKECSYMYIDHIKVEKFEFKVPLDFNNKTTTISYDKDYVLKDVHFLDGQKQLKPISYITLDHLVAYLNTNPETKIVLIGHTDNRHEESINQKYAKDKAKVIETYLVEHKIAATRIKATGKGSQEPIAMNNTKNNLDKNNRVEIIFQKN